MDTNEILSFVEYGAIIIVIIVLILLFVFRRRKQQHKQAVKKIPDEPRMSQQPELETDPVSEKEIEPPNKQSENSGTQTEPEHIIMNRNEQDYLTLKNGDSELDSSMNQYVEENKSNLRRRVVTKEANKAASRESSRHGSFINLTKLDKPEKLDVPWVDTTNDVESLVGDIVKDSSLSSFEDDDKGRRRKSAADLNVADSVFDNRGSTAKAKDKESDINAPSTVDRPSGGSGKLDPVIVESAFEPAMLNVNENGLRLEAPYCRIEIPRNAVTGRYTIKVVPHYQPQARLRGKMFITPVLEFKSAQSMNFMTDVHVQLRTPYASLKPDKPIIVEIVKLKHNETEYKTFATAKLGTDGFISFWCRSFCRVGSVMNTPDAPSSVKRYYSAALVSEPVDSQSRTVFWMVCEDMPNLKESNKPYFEVTDNRRLISAETFDAGYHYDLRLKLTNAGQVQMPNTNSTPATSINNEPQIHIEPAFAEVFLHRRYGLGFDEKSHFCLLTNEGNDGFHQRLRYHVRKIHVNDDMENSDVFQKHCYLNWRQIPVPAVNQQLTVNAVGAHSTGFKIGNFDPTQSGQGFQTSGYISGLGNIVSAAVSYNQEPSLITGQQSIQPSFSANPGNPGTFSGSNRPSQTVDPGQQSEVSRQVQHPATTTLPVETLGAASMMTEVASVPITPVQNTRVEEVSNAGFDISSLGMTQPKEAEETRHHTEVENPDGRCEADRAFRELDTVD